MSNNDLETISVDTIRALCMDAIQAANSGRPGTLLAYDTQRTVATAKALHARADRRNLFIKIPGTPEGLPAITAPAGLTDTVALAVGLDVYRAYREVMGSQRFQRLENAGARMRRLLWAGTRTKDPAASDTLQVHGLAAPFTVNTMPDGDGGGRGVAPGDGGQPPDERAAGRGAHPVPARHAGRALRAQRVHPGGRSGGATPSTSGASSSAMCLLSRSSRSSRARPTLNSATTRPRTR